MIRRFDQRLHFVGALGAILISLSSGCGGDSQAYAPSQTSARQALESALSAWRKGEKPDALASATPAVIAVDAEWQGGRALESYQILEETSGELEKRFTVRLGLKAPQGSKTPQGDRRVTYVILGQGPVWVYREEDYARQMNMDDNPQPGVGKPQRPGAGRRR